jgi:hypothetical protein
MDKEMTHSGIGFRIAQRISLIARDIVVEGCILESIG